MSPLPVQFTSRWGNRSRSSHDDAVCWHLLLGGHPAARGAATAARQRLARFGGLHMTPPQWLPVTVLRAGTADMVTQGDMDRMLARAQAELAQTAPVTVTLQRVFAPDALLQHGGSACGTRDRRTRQGAPGMRGDHRRDEPRRAGRP